MTGFKILHVGDGTNIADYIGGTMSCEKHSITVELQNLKRRRRISSCSSTLSSTADASYDFAVLVVTPTMIRHLEDMVRDDRIQLLNMLKTDQHAVAVTFAVQLPKVKDTFKSIFNDNELTWRYIEVAQDSKTSLHQCVFELINMHDRSLEEMPVPTLKKFHLLPDKPVWAQDTVYILVDKNFAETDTMETLNVVLKDGRQVVAMQVADFLYEFDVPESSASSVAIEVFTTEGETLGRDTIKYQNKLQVFADILNELLNLAKLETPQTKEEVNEHLKADSLIPDEKLSSERDIKKLLFQWIQTVKSDKKTTDMNLALPLVNLFANSSLATVAKSLLGMADLRLSDEANSSFKDESTEEDQETENNRSSDCLDEKDEDDAASSSAAGECYICPDDVVMSRSHIDSEHIPERTKSTVSDILPRTKKHSCRDHLCKSCPPDCSKHGHGGGDEEKTCYMNSSRERLKAKACRCNSHDSSASRGSPEPQLEADDGSDYLSESQANSNEELYEIPTEEAEEIIILLESSSEDLRPELPERRHRNSSERTSESSSKSLNRRSLVSLAGNTPPCLMNSSTLSLIKRCESKTSLNGQSIIDSPSRVPPRKPTTLSSSTWSLSRHCGYSRADSSTRSTPVTSPDGNPNVDKSVVSKVPPIPYRLRPSVPVPEIPTKKMAHSYSASDCTSVTSRGDTAGSRRQRNSSAGEEKSNSETVTDDSSPDYSEPNVAYFNDVNGLLRDMAEEEEAIYDKINEIYMDEEEETSVPASLYDFPRKGIHRCVSIDEVPASPLSPVPTSSAPSDPPTSHKKSSRSTTWSSFKFTMRKPGKSKKLNTKL